MATEIPEGWASWKAQGTGLWCISSPAQDAALVAEAERNPFFSARDVKAATGFPGGKNTIIARLKAAGLRARHAAVKELLSDQHKLHRLAFAESSVDRKWDRVIFTDEPTFSSANDGPVLVYRPQDSDATRNICLPANAVVVCLSTVGAGSPMKGLEFSILQTVTWTACSISIFSRM